MRGVLLRARLRGTADRDSQADQLTHSRAWPDIRRDHGRHQILSFLHDHGLRDNGPCHEVQIMFKSVLRTLQTIWK